jgi:hypothetical protein
MGVATRRARPNWIVHTNAGPTELVRAHDPIRSRVGPPCGPTRRIALLFLFNRVVVRHGWSPGAAKLIFFFVIFEAFVFSWLRFV